MKITNTAAFTKIIGSTPNDELDYANMLEFVFYTHPPVTGSGSLSVQLEGEYGRPNSFFLTSPGDAITNQEIHIGLSDTDVTIDN